MSDLLLFGDSEKPVVQEKREIKPIYHYDIEQNTDEWLQMKLGKFSASTASQLLMKTTNLGYIDLVNKICIERLTGKVIETYTNKDMQHGTDTEPMARQVFELETFQKVVQVGLVTLEGNEWVCVSLDGLIKDDGLLEIKCPKWNTHARLLDGTEGVDKKYKNQMQFQLYVTGREYCIYYDYYPGVKSYKEIFERDESKISEIDERVQETIELVKQRLKILKV